MYIHNDVYTYVYISALFMYLYKVKRNARHKALIFFSLNENDYILMQFESQ